MSPRVHQISDVRCPLGIRHSQLEAGTVDKQSGKPIPQIITKRPLKERKTRNKKSNRNLHDLSLVKSIQVSSYE